MKYEYWLSRLQHSGIGPAGRRKLREQFGSAREVYNAPVNRLRALSGLKEQQIDVIEESKRTWDLARYEKLEEAGIGLVTEQMDTFPQRLKKIPSGPDLLFYKGSLPEERRISVAIVGARSCSEYGREMALYFARELSACGVQIISGLAYGIDRYAHEGCLEVDGRTYGVLGCGVDLCYPRAHISLYTDIQKRGGLLSEFPPGTRPFSRHFPQRNRLISGLSDAVLVVEAQKKSGSLITADFALEQGRDVFAVPGRIGDIYSEGCNELIVQGAGLVDSVYRLREALGLQSEQIVNLERRKQMVLATEEELVYSCLGLQSKGLEALVQETNLPVSRLLTLLLSLQIKGYVKESEKGYYSISG